MRTLWKRRIACPGLCETLAQRMAFCTATRSALAPAGFFFIFNSAIIPFATVTMILAGLLFLAYERLLSRWSRRGLNDYQKLGLITDAIGFFALFFDLILDLSGPLGTIILGVLFTMFLYRLREQIGVEKLRIGLLGSFEPSSPSA